ncbi:RNB domain-containing ribonuclease [Helicobacter mesocricetorum]|uniref:RNB domain-containing ribonuclease n=1 Tax=Helicobacter mesocricetorum TaxID=87012 RepID=UPI000CF110D4|nr:ribonuclease R family protein [Helicobacter mesocricetorum]
MTEFIHLLKEGILTDSKLPSSFMNILETLKKFDAITTKKQQYLLKKSYCIGKIELTKEGYGFITPLPKINNQPDWLIEKKLLKNANKGDIALAKILTKTPHKTKAKVLTILERKCQNVIAYLEKYQLDCIAISIPNEIPYKIKASQKSLKMLPKGTLLKLNPKNGEILEILGTLEDSNIDEVLSLSLYQRQESFSLQAEIQAQNTKKVKIQDFKERINLTHLPFCTIDPKNAKDHDDAIFYDSQYSLLYIAIADVSHYVTPNSPLDIEAKNRSFSIYFPHKSIPMLPPALSENLCSLQEGKIRLAMTFKIRLHKRTKAILHTELLHSLIKVKQKLNYEEVDELLESKRSSIIKTPLKPMLLELNTLAQTLRKKRLQIGFDFLGDSLELELDKNTELKSAHLKYQTLSHQLVEECMLLANIQSAEMLEQKTSQKDSTLGIYRIHPKPKPQNIKALFLELKMLGLWKHNTIPKTTEAFHEAILRVQKSAKKAKLAIEVDKLIVKSMEQASYASHNIGHFGLGFKAYSHFTSPIRRYSDLLFHRILKEKITLTQMPSSKESLPSLCEDLSQKEREVAKIEQDFQDRKFARYLFKHIGQSYEGIIHSQNNHIPIVTLSSPPLIGAKVISLKNCGTKYQKVRIQILEVNLATAKIYGKVVEYLNEENKQLLHYFSHKLQNKPHKSQAKQTAKQLIKNIKTHKRKNNVSKRT